MFRVETTTYPNDFANTYFLIDGPNVIIIDPGSDGTSLSARIRREGWTIKAILLTHGHFDHINGAEYLQKVFAAPVYVHQEDEAMLSDPHLNGATMFRFSGNYDIKATTFGNDEVITIDTRKIITFHTPFHTKGSVCFYLPEEGWLFSGDTLFKGSIGRSDLPSGSFRTITASLTKLQSLPESVTVYPGHGPKTTIGYELKFNRYFQKR